MANYMSDVERDRKYRNALTLINEARRINKQVIRLRREYERSGEQYGYYGNVLDGLLAEAATIDAEAALELTEIDDDSQPVFRSNQSLGMYIHFFNAPDQHFTVNSPGGQDTTNYPNASGDGGTVVISNSSLGNDGTWPLLTRVSQRIRCDLSGGGPNGTNFFTGVDYTAVATWLLKE